VRRKLSSFIKKPLVGHQQWFFEFYNSIFIGSAELEDACYIKYPLLIPRSRAGEVRKTLLKVEGNKCWEYPLGGFSPTGIEICLYSPELTRSSGYAKNKER